MRTLDLTNKIFGRLIAVRPTRRRYKGCVVWECVCKCGRRTFADVGHLRTGDKRSCGCWRREGNNLKHGFMRKGKYHPAVGIWRNMLSRCYRPASKGYEHYGGRGIRVCRSWHKAENFILWVEQHPRPKGTWLERKNNNKGYNPENCSWATPKEQAANRRKRRNNK